MEPDPVAVHDQAQADAIQKARVVGAYWKQLRTEGVDDYDSTRLALDLQRRLFGHVVDDEGAP